MLVLVAMVVVTTTCDMMISIVAIERIIFMLKKKICVCVGWYYILTTLSKYCEPIVLKVCVFRYAYGPFVPNPTNLVKEIVSSFSYDPGSRQIFGGGALSVTFFCLFLDFFFVPSQHPRRSRDSTV